MSELVWKGEQFRQKLLTAVRQGVDAGAIVFQREVKKTLNQTASNAQVGSASAPGEPPSKDTGTLGRSIQIDRTEINNPTSPKARVGTNLPYAAIQEFGGRIEAKNVKYLTIPMTIEAKRMRRRYASLRQVPGLVFWQRRGQKDGGFLVRWKGKGKNKRIEFLFKLVRETVIPPRPYFRPTIERTRRLVADEVWKPISKVLA